MVEIKVLDTLSTKEKIKMFKKARKKLKKNWCTNAYARDGRGRACDPRHHNAESWCAVGSLVSVTREENHADLLAEVLHRQIEADAGFSIGDSNPGMTM